MADGNDIFCAQCSNVVSNDCAQIICSVCNGVYHKKCSKLKAKSFEVLIKTDDFDWICSSCRDNLKTKKRGRSSLCLENTNDNTKLLKELLKEQSELKSAIQFMSDQYEVLKKFVSEFSIVKKENEVLKTKCFDLETKCNRLEQYSKNFNLEISGVPQTKNENTYSIIGNILAAIEAKVDVDDIEYCHRLYPKNKNEEETPKIVAKFYSRQKKHHILDKLKQFRAKHNRHLSCSDLPDYDSNKSRIFINEHLTAHNKHIFWLARNLRSVGYKFVWVKDGQVKIKKDEQSKVININSPLDIQRLTGANKQQSGSG
jgi:hypothetical protein